MADGKWIDGLDPEMSAPQAAKHILAVRLDVVQRRLGPALEDDDHDPENVHQLRVSTRRADAALRIFEDCLPRKTFKEARRRLKKLRRAAGVVRDWDVFLDDLQSPAKPPPAAQLGGRDFLAGFAVGQRTAAREGLLDKGRAELPHLSAFLAGTIEAIRLPAGDPAGDTLLNRGRGLLRVLLANLERAAGGDLDDYSQLHQVRIAGKRLRYAMEVFAACFPPFFVDELYGRVEEVQEMLGRANDSHVAGERLSRLRETLRAGRPREWRRWKAGVEAVLRVHTRRLPQERRRFLRWWKAWTDAATRKQWDLLVGGAPAVGKNDRHAAVTAGDA
jgi:CHAD domain-containing protein